MVLGGTGRLGRAEQSLALGFGAFLLGNVPRDVDRADAMADLVEERARAHEEVAAEPALVNLGDVLLAVDHREGMGTLRQRPRLVMNAVVAEAADAISRTAAQAIRQRPVRAHDPVVFVDDRDQIGHAVEGPFPFGRCPAEREFRPPERSDVEERADGASGPAVLVAQGGRVRDHGERRAVRADHIERHTGDHRAAESALHGQLVHRQLAPVLDEPEGRRARTAFREIAAGRDAEHALIGRIAANVAAVGTFRQGQADRHGVEDRLQLGRAELQGLVEPFDLERRQLALSDVDHDAVGTYGLTVRVALELAAGLDPAHGAVGPECAEIGDILACLLHAAFQRRLGGRAILGMNAARPGFLAGDHLARLETQHAIVFLVPGHFT